MTNARYRNEPLDNAALMAVAPSIFATEPWHKMSDRYAFIPTIQIVERMRAEGFQPYKAVQSRTRIEGKSEFTRHQIRFRDVRHGTAALMPELGHLFAELILTNSHDGASKYVLDAGLFRLVCLNGMTVDAGQYGQISVRHSGDADGVINASYEVVEEFPKVLNSVEEFSRLQLTAGEQKAYAAAALELRYDDGAAPVMPEAILRPKRREDAEPTLWNTFNTAQEHLLNGGARGSQIITDPNTGRRRVKHASVRVVNGISESTNLNRALWRLSEEMRKLKSN